MYRFRLHKIFIYNHKVLGDVRLEFCPNSDDVFDFTNTNLYTTVIIGENGVGKSYLLSAIIKIFTYIDSEKRNEYESDTIDFSFEIEYSIGNGNLYRISNFGQRNDLRIKKHLFAFINNIPCELDCINLPSKVIASTMTLSDKFVAKSHGIYQYRGVRNENDPIRTGTKTLTRKVVSYLINSFRNHENIKENIEELLKVLDFAPQISLSYEVKYKDVFFYGGITPQEFCYIYNNQSEFFPKRKDSIWGTSNFKKIQSDILSLEIITDYLNSHSHELKATKKIHYEILNDTENLLKDIVAIDLLSQLGLLFNPSLIFTKTEHFSFEDASSGESNLLCQMLGIMSDIERSSLVIIDEPETSSHPNWQINYINWLQKIFRKYGDCHFIIASHSHFLLTDLQPQCSSIIALAKENNGHIVNIANNVNAYCWSVDDILYRVFKVKNTRNFYFEKNFFKLFDLLEKPQGKEQDIISLYDELKSYRLNDDDPYKVLLEEAKNVKLK